MLPKSPYLALMVNLISKYFWKEYEFEFEK